MNTSEVCLNSFLKILLVETAFKLSSKLPIDYLKQLTSYIQHPESYNLNIAEDNIIPSSNPDSPLEPFNVWYDLKEKVTNHVINSPGLYKERFASTCENVYGECVASDHFGFCCKWNSLVCFFKADVWWWGCYRNLKSNSDTSNSNSNKSSNSSNTNNR